MGQPTFDQDAFRGRDDDVALNSAAFTRALNTNWTQLTDTAFRVRFLIQETGTATGPDRKFTLYYTYNGGANTPIEDGPELVAAESLQYSDGAATNQVLGGGTYISGESLGGVEAGFLTGNIDVEQGNEFEIEFCLVINGSVVAEGGTLVLQVRAENGTVLASYTNTPTITITLPPQPDVSGYLGDVVFEAGSFVDLYGAAGWSAVNQYFEQGNNTTHPPSIQPLLVVLVGNSLRMKSAGVLGPGLFPAGADDTITRTITGLSAGRYVYEYYQVSHDEGTRTTRLLSGAGATEVLLITGPESDGDTIWAGPFHHVFDHLGGDLVIEVYYDNVDDPGTQDSGIKDSAILIREYVGFTLDLTAEGSVSPAAGWVAPITDRVQADLIARNAKAFFNLVDWTRIHDNTAVVDGQVAALLGLSVTLIELSTPAISDHPTAGSINDLVENIERVRIGAALPAGIGLVELKTDWAAGTGAPAPDYTHVNAWENNLDLLHEFLPIAAAYAVHCGVAATGQQRFYQHRWRG